MSMNTKSSTVQVADLRSRDTYLAVVAIASGFVFLAMWYLTPELLTEPLWSGASLTIAFLLGTFAVFIPVFVAWLIIAKDMPSAAGETFEVSDH